MTDPRTKRKILLVDDTRTVIMYEKMVLAGQGFDIDVAGDGLEALEKATSFNPDVILLDIMMPKLNGIEACQRLKSDPKTKSIPVIMVTTKGDREKVEAAFAAGCNDFVTKPINKLQLLTKIRNALN